MKITDQCAAYSSRASHVAVTEDGYTWVAFDRAGMLIVLDPQCNEVSRAMMPAMIQQIDVLPDGTAAVLCAARRSFDGALMTDSRVLLLGLDAKVAATRSTTLRRGAQLVAESSTRIHVASQIEARTSIGTQREATLSDRSLRLARSNVDDAGWAYTPRSLFVIAQRTAPVAAVSLLRVNGWPVACSPVINGAWVAYRNWRGRSTYSLLRLAAGTGVYATELAEVPLPADYKQHLATRDQSVWLSDNAGTLTRYDLLGARTLEVERFDSRGKFQHFHCNRAGSELVALVHTDGGCAVYRRTIT